MAFPANGQSASAAFQDPLAKVIFNARAYKIDATVTTGADLSATTQVRLEERASGERVVLFALNANLRVESVKDAQGTALAFFQPREPKDRSITYGEYIAVVLAQPSHAGDTQTLEFRYAGKRVVRKVGEGNYFCPSENWYPAENNNFAKRADFEMTFHAPKKLTLVATGSPVGEAKDGVSNWKSDIPLAVAGFAYGEYKEQHEKVGAVDIDVFANRNPDDF